ncbi:hypothetical protein, partial [Escherichia coli]|uniref:hypothetical protein n=1 Tax=Escherichia coli TaxID=562 RepID=UPI001BC87316
MLKNPAVIKLKMIPGFTFLAVKIKKYINWYSLCWCMVQVAGLMLKNPAVIKLKMIPGFTF